MNALFFVGGVNGPILGHVFRNEEFEYGAKPGSFGSFVLLIFFQDTVFGFFDFFF